MVFYDAGWFVAALLFLYSLASTGACMRLASRLASTERALRETQETE
jgi:hypothetical protein